MEETNLKVRLVGATVLVSLAVIFIPMVLDGRESSGAVIAETNIPPKPERGFTSKVIPLTPTISVKPETAAKPVIKKGLAAQVAPETDKAEKPASKPKATKQPAPVKVAKAVVDKPKSKTNTVKKPSTGLSAWAVQVGSFGSKKNAFALRDKLRKKGFTAFVDTIYERDTASFRVRVGPELKRELAEKLRKKLAGFYKGRTFIVKHPS